MNSGYIWWSGQSADAIAACKASDAECGQEPREFEKVSIGDIARASYAVYAIPATLSIDDGQDEAQISAVDADRFVAYYEAL